MIKKEEIGSLFEGATAEPNSEVMRLLTEAEVDAVSGASHQQGPGSQHDQNRGTNYQQSPFTQYRQHAIEPPPGDSEQISL